MADEKIIARVQKLLNLANDDAASEGERENALRMAHATLLKHNIDMSQVDKFTRDKEDPREEMAVDGWNLVWCRGVRDAVARLFFCKYLIGGKINATRGRHYYIGRTSNVATAAYMSDWIIAGILKEADRLHGHRLNPNGRSFCVGVEDTIRHRVNRMITEAQQNDTPDTPAGTALVVMELYKSELDANAAFIAEQYGEIKSQKRRDTGVNEAAYSQGVSYGNTVNLSRQLGESTTSTKRLK